jgi:hypothetical protein
MILYGAYQYFRYYLAGRNIALAERNFIPIKSKLHDTCAIT